MSVNFTIRERLTDDALVFDNQAYDNAILGVTFDGRVIYSYEKMIIEYMEDHECSEEEATDWIDYNTIRSLPYAGDKAPIIVSTFLEELV